MWVAVGIIGWLALGYLGARQIIKYDSIEATFGFVLMIFGPGTAIIGLIFWLSSVLADKDTTAIAKKFFNIKS